MNICGETSDLEASLIHRSGPCPGISRDMLVVTGLLVRLSPGRSDLFDYRFALALKWVTL